MKVLSVTRDMAPNYDWLARTTFPNAYQVADKFRVLREILEQLQSVRIRHWQAVLTLERKKNKTVKEKLTLQEKVPQRRHPQATPTPLEGSPFQAQNGVDRRPKGAGEDTLQVIP